MIGGETVVLTPSGRDDNSYAESLFRTAKYRPEFPVKGSATQEAVRNWGAAFVHWYNVEHKHSGIRYVSSQQRHTGEDHAILGACHALYAQARELNPARWSGKTRNWPSMGARALSISNATPSSQRIRAATISGRWLHERDDKHLDARRYAAFVM